MRISVYDSGFNRVYELDTYESFLWVDKYDEPGTFELYAYPSTDLLTNCRTGRYLKTDVSDRTMVIEDFTIETDVEKGNHIKVIGRSIESILDRRIVWKQTTLSGSFLSGIQTLLNDAIINPTDTNRKINNFYFTASTDTRITSLTVDHQFTGDNLLDVIETLCQENNLGFRLLVNNYGTFDFLIFKGADKSDLVMFKPSLDNLLSSNYKEENSTFKNIALVAGEGEGTARKTATTGDTTVTGLNRKELYVDARDISKESGMTDAKYTTLLKNRGQENLIENSVVKEYDGKCETTQIFVYNRDFYIGDVVQIENEFGIKSKARITEFTWSHSSSGLESYPTFTAIDE